jgi:cytoskeletal protein CcmA (bactofilin family)
MPKAITMPPASIVSPVGPVAAVPSSLGATLHIRGTVSAEEDLDISATIRGAVSAPAQCVVVRAEADVKADILARDLTVHGHVQGRLTATEIIDIQSTARVDGQVVAPRVLLAEGGVVQGRVETRRVDAAVRVAQYRRRQ